MRLTKAKRKELSELGTPKIRLKKGQRWVWTQTYGKFCLPIIMEPNGELIECDGETEYPHHILRANPCDDPKHSHHKATRKAIEKLIARCIREIPHGRSPL